MSSPVARLVLSLLLLLPVLPIAAGADPIPPPAEPAAGRPWRVDIDGPASASDTPGPLVLSPDGSRTYSLVTTSGRHTTQSNIVVLAHDSAGALLWASTYDTPTHSAETGAGIAVSPDGTRIFATATTVQGLENVLTVAFGADGGFLWVTTFDAGFREYASGVAVSADGEVVYTTGSAYDDYAVVAYDASSGLERWRTIVDSLDQDWDNLRGSALSPDGGTIYGFGYSFFYGPRGDISVFALSTADGSLRWLSRWIGPNGPPYADVYGIAVSPDGSRLALVGRTPSATGYDAIVLVYNAATGSEAWTASYDMAGREDGAFGVAFTTDGSKLLVSAHGRPASPAIDYVSVLLGYDPASGALLSTLTFSEATISILGGGLYPAPDGSLLQLLGRGWGPDYVETTVLVRRDPAGAVTWSRNVGALKGFAVLPGFTGYMALAATYSPAQRYDAVASRLDAVGATVWSATWDGVGSANDVVTATAFDAARSRVFATGTTDGTGQPHAQTAAVDATSGSLLWMRRNDADFESMPTAAAVTPDGTTLVVVGRAVTSGGASDWLVLAYSAQNGNLLWRRTIDGGSFYSEVASAVVATSDSSRFVVAGLRESAGGNRDAVALGLNANDGTTAWTLAYDSPSHGADAFVDAALVPGGSVILVGSAIGAGGTQDILTMAANPASGAVQWTRVDAAGAGADRARSVAASSTSIAVGADSDGTGLDALVLNLATDGSQRWSARYDAGSSDAVARVLLAPSGDVVLAATSWIDRQWYSGPDMNWARFEAATGALLWRWSEDGLGGAADFVQDAALSPDGSRLFVAGHSWDDAQSLRIDMATGRGGYPITEKGVPYDDMNPSRGDEIVRVTATGAAAAIVAAKLSRTHDLFGPSDFTLISYSYTGIAGAAQNFAASAASQDSIHLTWDLPASDGGSEIIAFRLWRGPVGGPHEVILPRGFTWFTGQGYTDTGLAPDSAYEYRISMLTDAGEGAIASVVGRTPGRPTAPQNPSAGPGGNAGEVYVTWSPPSYDGGYPLSKYSVYRGADPQALAWVADIDPGWPYFVDSGLPDAATFWYAVTAHNSVGESDRSPVVSGRTPNPPSVPLNVRTETGPQAGEITVKWSAPASSGDLPVDGYAIYRGTDAGNLQFAAWAGTTPTQYVDSGLGVGETYYYAVAASNGAIGPASVAVAGTTAVPPGPVPYTLASGGPGDGQASVQWGAPAATGGSPVTGYRIYRGDSAGSLVSIGEAASYARLFTDNGLARNARVYYAVRAVTGAGEGPLGPVASALTPDLPSAARDVRAAPGTLPGDVRVSWRAPASTGNIRIDRYDIYRSGDEGALWEFAGTAQGTSVVFTDSNRQPLVGWTYAVVAVNRVGEGPWSGTACSNAAPWIVIGGVTTACQLVAP